MALASFLKVLVKGLMVGGFLRPVGVCLLFVFDAGGLYINTFGVACHSGCVWLFGGRGVTRHVFVLRLVCVRARLFFVACHIICFFNGLIFSV